MIVILNTKLYIIMKPIPYINLRFKIDQQINQQIDQQIDQ